MLGEKNAYGLTDSRDFHNVEVLSGIRNQTAGLIRKEGNETEKRRNVWKPVEVRMSTTIDLDLLAKVRMTLGFHD